MFATFKYRGNLIVGWFDYETDRVHAIATPYNSDGTLDEDNQVSVNFSSIDNGIELENLILGDLLRQKLEGDKL